MTIIVNKGGVNIYTGNGDMVINITDSVPPPPPPPSGDLAVGSNGGIMWSVNIHYARNVAGTPGDVVMSTAASLGFRSTRTDLYTIADQSFLTAALASAAKVKIKVLPILMGQINFADYADETSAYNAGKAHGSSYGTAFKGRVGVWELFNELNGPIGYNGNGSLASDYNQTNLAKTRGLARGLMEGLRAADPACKIAFGSNSAIEAWGWLDGLWSAGIRWDITSTHYYSNMGNNVITELALHQGVTDLLAQNLIKYPGTVNWITEFNYWGPDNTNSDAQTAAYLTRTMAQYDAMAKNANKRLEAVYIYQLLEEPGTDNGRHLGLMNNAGTATQASNAVKTYLAAHPSVVYR